MRRQGSQRLTVLRDFRKSYGYVGSVEYYPIMGARPTIVFLAYVGRKVTIKRVLA